MLSESERKLNTGWVKQASVFNQRLTAWPLGLRCGPVVGSVVHSQGPF